MTASVVLLFSGAAALFQAGTAADEGRIVVDGALPVLWLMFGTGLLGLAISLPNYLGYLRNDRGQTLPMVPAELPCTADQDFVHPASTW